jgi:hypothetical protein
MPHIIIEDFEAAGFHCDLEMTLTNYTPGDPSAGCEPEWEFTCTGWRNLICNSRGYRKTEPKWNAPNFRLGCRLEQLFEGYFYCLSRQDRQEFLSPIFI